MYTDNEYALAVERFFGVSGIQTRSGIYCDRKSREANQANPLEIDNTTLDELKYRNRADSALYENLVTCPTGYHFPSTTLEDHVATLHDW